MVIGDWLRARRIFTPEAIAVLEGGIRYTYEMLYDRASRWANFLFRICKIKKGDRVAILSNNSVTYLDIFFAAAKIGAIIVPVPGGISCERMGDIIANASPKLLFYSSGHSKIVKALESLYPDVSFLNLDEDHCEQVSEYSNPVEEVEVSLEDPLMLAYEPGEEGGMRGAIQSHGMMLWNSINTIMTFRLTPDDTLLLSLPLWSAAGLGMLTLPLIYGGGRVIISLDSNQQELPSDLIGRERVTILAPEADTLQALPEYLREFDRSSLRLAISAGLAPRDAVDLIKALGITFAQGYVLDVAGPNNFFIPWKGEEALGYPFFHVDTAIADRNGGLIGEGKTGELLIRGHHIFSGYWNNPTATSQAFLKGWVRTGDLAMCRNGLYYMVRQKSRRGRYIKPQAGDTYE